MIINGTVRKWHLTLDCKAHPHHLRHVYMRKIQKDEYVWILLNNLTLQRTSAKYRVLRCLTRYCKLWHSPNTRYSRPGVNFYSFCSSSGRYPLADATFGMGGGTFCSIKAVHCGLNLTMLAVTEKNYTFCAWFCMSTSLVPEH